MAKQKILIVDDRAENLYALEHVLKELDVEVIKATNGNDALIAILNHDFCMAILDVQMPGMDGYELAEFIRSEEKTQYLPVIFLSAVFSDDFHVFKGYQSGAVDFITKPFNPEILLNKVKVFLKLDQQKIELHKKNQQLREEIQQRKKVEESLRKNREQLKELNATKDKFFSIVAHDLKNPFNTLIGFSELLIYNADEISEEKIQHFYQLIHNAAKTGYNLLANLLEWSRSQTGRLRWSPVRFNLASICKDNLSFLTGSAKKKEISLSCSVSDKIYVFADMNMITTVLRNLISNALKFTDGGGKVDILARSHGETIEVQVCDTGIGISPEDITKLFRIDVNHSTIGTGEEKGTGLGLILCKEFVEKNNGKIWVESTPGKGSTFFFTLPASEPQAQQ